jgi:hypothetical protein
MPSSARSDTRITPWFGLVSTTSAGLPSLVRSATTFTTNTDRSFLVTLNRPSPSGSTDATFA